jgi:hypothetical protein
LQSDAQALAGLRRERNDFVIGRVTAALGASPEVVSYLAHRVEASAAATAQRAAELEAAGAAGGAGPAPEGGEEEERERAAWAAKLETCAAAAAAAALLPFVLLRGFCFRALHGTLHGIERPRLWSFGICTPRVHPRFFVLFSRPT